MQFGSTARAVLCVWWYRAPAQSVSAFVQKQMFRDRKRRYSNTLRIADDAELKHATQFSPYRYTYFHAPVPVPARSKAWVYGHSLVGIAGSNPAKGMKVYLLSVVCRLVEVSASGWLLLQRSATECGVSECDRETWTMRRPWPNGGWWVKKNVNFYIVRNRVIR